jgi:hypothetical protein
MPAMKYRCTWDAIASLDADHMSGWGAFERGCNHTIDFDDDDLPELAFDMSAERDEFTAVYRIGDADFVRSRVALERRPCRFGGTRAYFIAPCCGRRTLRLAVLPQGLRCGACGRVTWGSRREQPVHRLIRRANKTAVRLGLDAWHEQPTKRPPYMRMTTYAALSAERDQLAADINRHISAKLARSGLLARLSLLTRL